MHDRAPKCHGKFVFEPSPQGYCFHCTFLWGGHMGSHRAVPGDHPETWRFKTAKSGVTVLGVQEMPAQVPHTAGITTFTITSWRWLDWFDWTHWRHRDPFAHHRAERWLLLVERWTSVVWTLIIITRWNSLPRSRWPRPLLLEPLLLLPLLGAPVTPWTLLWGLPSVCGIHEGLSWSRKDQRRRLCKGQKDGARWSSSSIHPYVICNTSPRVQRSRGYV